QRLCGDRVQPELATMRPGLVDAHAIVPLGRPKRYVPGAHVGQYSLGLAVKRTPEATPAASLGNVAVADVESCRFDLAGREPLLTAVFARNADTVGLPRQTAIQAPGWAKCALHLRLVHGRYAQL